MLCISNLTLKPRPAVPSPSSRRHSSPSGSKPAPDPNPLPLHSQPSPTCPPIHPTTSSLSPGRVRPPQLPSPAPAAGKTMARPCLISLFRSSSLLLLPFLSLNPLPLSVQERAGARPSSMAPPPSFCFVRRPPSSKQEPELFLPRPPCQVVRLVRAGARFPLAHEHPRPCLADNEQ